MDDRRRTISSEEQMIGEALMRVSNTLEAQRLTKSLDYQEKLRSRSNIRLIIAIICLFVAMMMMVISGSILFMLWRYADPVLDVVVPFLKGMMGDFGIIWDGLVESLSYVPVMVEQLTRLLEQVIIMLEGINSIDLAGMMGYLSKMLGGLVTMMDDLQAAMKPIMAALNTMIQTFMDEGIDGILKQLLGPDAAENLSKLMNGIMDMLGATGTTLSTFAGSLEENLDKSDIDNLVTNTSALIGQTGDTLGDVTASIKENFKKEDIDTLVAGTSALVGQAGESLGDVATSIKENLNKEDIDNLVSNISQFIDSTGNTIGEIRVAIEENVNEESVGNLVAGVDSLVNSSGDALKEVASGLSGIDSADVAKVVESGKKTLEGTSTALEGLGNALDQLGTAMNSINIKLPSWLTGG